MKKILFCLASLGFAVATQAQKNRTRVHATNGQRREINGQYGS